MATTSVQIVMEARAHATRLTTLEGRFSDDEIADLESSNCNTTCQSYVLDQLTTEVTILAELNVWYEQYATLQSKTSEGLIIGLEAADAYMSMTDTVYIPAPASSDDGWFSTLIATVTEVADVAALVTGASGIVNALKLAAGTATLVNDVVSSDGTSTSTDGINFDQNNMLDLTYADLLTSTQSTYDNLNSVAGNQVSAICSNYGKLLAFESDVYPYYAAASTESINEWIAATDSYFDWKGFVWLFSSKYQICFNTDYSLDYPSCNSDQATESYKPSTYEYEEATYITAGTSAGACDIRPRMYFSESGDCDAFPSADFMAVYNNNTYAVDNGIVSSSGYVDSSLAACADEITINTSKQTSSSPSNCTFADITLDMEDNGDCKYAGDGGVCCGSGTGTTGNAYDECIQYFFG